MNDFRGKKAWFSASVSKECKQVWVQNGGKTEKDIQSADYIFADDPSAPDISRFYKSSLFLDKGIQPFRSAWLLETNKSILDFILYPEDFKENVVNEEWAVEDNMISSPNFHMHNNLKNTCSQDSESSVSLDDGEEILYPSSHKKFKNLQSEIEEESSLEWDFKDKSSSPTFFRLRDFRNADLQDHSDSHVCLDEDEVLGPTTLNHKKLENTPVDEKETGGPDVLEEAPKVPIPVQNEYTLKDENTLQQTTNSPAVSPNLVNTKKQVYRRKSKEKPDAKLLLSMSASLQELEIPTHVFHSSMHDGFTRIEDIELPEGLELKDFFMEDDKETAAEYQVYLKHPSLKVHNET